MKLYKQLLLGALVAGLVVFSATAAAGDYGYSYHPGEYGDSYDYARVTDVIPVYTDIQVREPRTRCWDEQMAYRERGGSATGTIIGGIIGAALGNELGHHKRNKQVGAVAGAALGASIGHDLSRRNGRTRYVTEQRCQVVDEYTSRRELVGYDVRYRYNGRHYMTRTDHHPGDRIRVRVDVTPSF